MYLEVFYSRVFLCNISLQSLCYVVDGWTRRPRGIKATLFEGNHTTVHTQTASEDFYRDSFTHDRYIRCNKWREVFSSLFSVTREPTHATRRFRALIKPINYTRWSTVRIEADALKWRITHVHCSLRRMTNVLVTWCGVVDLVPRNSLIHVCDITVMCPITWIRLL